MNEDEEPDFSWRDFIIAAGQAWNEGVQRVAAASAGALGQVETWAEAARPIVEGLGRAAVQFRDAYDEGVPSGWRELRTPQMFAVIELMQRTGWCLTTTPPPRTLLRLLEAPDDERRGELLLAAEPQILIDLDTELRAADDGRLRPYATAAREAWEAHSGGLFMASQALSATTVAALSHGRGPLAPKTLGAARARFDSLDIEEAGLREIRFYAVAKAVGQVLSNFPPTGSEPALFNRHAVAHGVSLQQFNQLNSLTALMLACGWLREIMWLARVAETE